MWRKNLFFLTSLLPFSCTTSLAQDDSVPVRRILLNGYFAVCNNVHIMHNFCYGRWMGGCPTCHGTIKDDKVVVVDSIWVSPAQLADACVICSGSISEGSIFEPTAPPLEAGRCEEERRARETLIERVSLPAKFNPAGLMQLRREHEARLKDCCEPAVKAALKASWKDFMKTSFTH